MLQPCDNLGYGLASDGLSEVDCTCIMGLAPAIVYIIMYSGNIGKKNIWQIAPCRDFNLANLFFHVIFIVTKVLNSNLGGF